MNRIIYGAALWLPVALAGLGAKMGVKDHTCDDGKTNLGIDWNGSFAEFTCEHRRYWKANPKIAPQTFSIKDLDIFGDGQNVYHHCMNETIEYKDTPPLRGDHRPIWARFGEYLYLPTQRWLHNLEHGTIVMLYHPCADSREVWALRRLLTACLYRHVITPYAGLGMERPMALLSWGSRLLLNTVDVGAAKAFIRKHAKVAPEDISRDGQYDEYLLKPAGIVSDQDDSVLCPDPFHGTEQDEAAIEEEEHARVKRRGDPNTEYYNRIYLAQLQRFNGPKYAADVLPPSAVLNQFRQPKYVMAGTYLGKDPLNPQIIPHTPNVPRPPPRPQAPLFQPNSQNPPEEQPSLKFPSQSQIEFHQTSSPFVAAPAAPVAQTPAPAQQSQLFNQQQQGQQFPNSQQQFNSQQPQHFIQQQSFPQQQAQFPQQQMGKFPPQQVTQLGRSSQIPAQSAGAFQAQSSFQGGQPSSFVQPQGYPSQSGPGGFSPAQLRLQQEQFEARQRLRISQQQQIAANAQQQQPGAMRPGLRTPPNAQRMAGPAQNIPQAEPGSQDSFRADLLQLLWRYVASNPQSGH